jgi:hypothetical protein
VTGQTIIGEKDRADERGAWRWATCSTRAELITA